MRHPTAIDAFEVELRKAKAYLDANSDRPERWKCVQILRRVLKTGFATLREVQRTEPVEEGVTP